MKQIVYLIVLATPVAALAHDTWVQTNSSIVRTGDVVHIDLMLGNHGNGHRDFKIAGKLSLEGATLELIDPEGKHFDLKERLVDTGYTPQEGYWTARFEPTKPGLYTIAHRSDRVMSYAPERSVKCGKAFFVASTSLDRVPATNSGFDQTLGHELEIVPLLNPVTPMGPGSPLKVRLWGGLRRFATIVLTRLRTFMSTRRYPCAFPLRASHRGFAIELGSQMRFSVGNSDIFVANAALPLADRDQ